MGKPYKESFDEVGWSASAIDYYAEIARHENGKVLGSAVDGQFHFTTKDPLGVVVIILPFNYPLCLLCWQAAAALASGNAVIIKPSELTTLTTLQFVAAFDALPSGLVQVITGGGGAGKQLVEHPDTHMVAFTGRHRDRAAHRRDLRPLYKRTLIETSGNDPFIVMPSAPLDIAARGAAFGAFLNCGQVCAAAERFYVHEQVYAEFIGDGSCIHRARSASATASTGSTWARSPRSASSRGICAFSKAPTAALRPAHRRRPPRRISRKAGSSSRRFSARCRRMPPS